MFIRKFSKNCKEILKFFGTSIPYMIFIRLNPIKKIITFIYFSLLLTPKSNSSMKHMKTHICDIGPERVNNSAKSSTII